MKNAVLILDGNSEIGVHVRCEIGNVICLRNLFRSRAAANLTIFHVILYACALISDQLFI